MSGRIAAAERTDDLALEEKELSALARDLVRVAQRKGADEAEAYVVRSRSVAVRFEKGDLKLVQVDDGTSLGLRVFRERRLGFASTNRTDEHALERAAEDALGLAKFSPPDDANRLLEPSARPTPLVLVERELAALGVDEVVALASGFLAPVRDADRRISIDNAEVTMMRGTRAVHNTRGVDSVESDAELGFSVVGMALDGAEVGGMHYDSDSVRRMRDVEPAMQRVASEFVRVALGNLAAGSGESYRGPILLSPAALISLVIGPIVGASSAIAVQRKRSPFVGKLGDLVASRMLSIHDDPHDASLSGATSFDREGYATSRFALVDDGQLKSFLYNGYAAAVEGRRSTGHAQGGPRSVPALGPHALSIAPGDGGDRDDMLASLGRGLFAQRFSGTVDPTSGDFSGVAKSARWIEGGAVVRSLNETLVSGNSLALAKSIVKLSTIVERCSGRARVPYAIVDGVSVTAG